MPVIAPRQGLKTIQNVASNGNPHGNVTISQKQAVESSLDVGSVCTLGNLAKAKGKPLWSNVVSGGEAIELVGHHVPVRGKEVGVRHACAVAPFSAMAAIWPKVSSTLAIRLSASSA